MRATLALTALLTTAVLVGAAPAGATTPGDVDAPAAAFETPGTACEGTSGTVAAVLLPTGDAYGSGTSLTVLPGSTVRVVLCDEGEAVATSRWRPGLPDGFESASVTDAGGPSYRVRVTAAADGAAVTVTGSSSDVELDERSGPSLAVATGATADVDVGDGSPRVRFASVEDRNAYADAEARYATLAESLRNDSTKLQGLADELNRSSAPLNGSRMGEANGTVGRLDRVAGLTERRREATALLFAAAMRGNSSAAAAMGAYRADERETRAEVRSALTAYRDALETRRTGAAGGLAVNLVAALLVGSLLGGGGGWLYTRRRLEGVRRARQYSADETYGIRQMGPQLLVGVVLALAAVGLLLASGVLAGLGRVVVP